MADSLESVNVALRMYRRWQTEPNDKHSDTQRARWGAVADDLESFAAELTRLRSWARPVPASYGDLSDLPPELLSQISGVKTDELEDQIYVTVKAAGDQIDLDHLLIELYRRFGDVHQRRFMMNKAYRMAQKGLIHLVPGKKGVYSTQLQAPAPEADLAAGFAPATETGFTPPPRRETFSADLDDEIPF